MIQPHLPIRLPCYDFTPIIEPTFGRAPDDAGVAWQVGEYGKVDQGGAGTVAAEIAHYGIEVVDCGVPLLSMHSVTELASKYDIYEMLRASVAFLKS